MKVLFIMPQEISVGGIESIILSLWQEMLHQSIRVDFVCHGYKKGLYEDYITSKGSKVFHIPVKSQNFPGMKREFKKILRTGHYDVVHSNMNATSGIYLQMAQDFGVPVRVAHSHVSNMRTFTKNPLKALINEYFKLSTNKYSNLKIGCSQTAGKWLFGSNDFEVLLNGIDINKYKFNQSIRKEMREKLNLGKGTTVVIHVGSFLKVKNHRFIINIFEELQKIRSDSKLLLVGDGPEMLSIKEMAKKAGLQDKIIFLGIRQDVNRLLQAADSFILPSKSEGNPVSLTEALGAGLPCIASTKVPDDLRAYFNSNQLTYIDIDSKKSSVKWAKEIINDSTRKQYNNENFPLTIEKTVKTLLSLYKEKAQ